MISVQRDGNVFGFAIANFFHTSVLVPCESSIRTGLHQDMYILVKGMGKSVLVYRTIPG